MGASFDPPQANKKFKDNNNFQYELWTDGKKELALFFGAAKNPTQFFADRITVVIDAQGHWLLSYKVVSDLAGHPKKVLADCQKLFGATP